MSKADVDAIIEHLAECTEAKASIVVDGSADDVVAEMVRAGWVLDERTDHVSGKRIRFLRHPGNAETGGVSE